MCIKRENVRMAKKPYASWDGSGDEFDWFDFKYAVGLKAASNFDGYCKAVCYSTNPFTGEPRVSLPKYIQIDLARDSDECGSSLLNQLFRQIGSVEMYGLSNRKGLCFMHRHHDNPVDGDLIVVTPCSEKTYRRHHM